MKVIINADDFGISSKVNGAIYRSALNGFITSSTIIPVSAQFDEAIEMTKDLNNISFGIHLTFTDNFRSVLKKPEIFKENDILKLKSINFFKLNILINEFSKQIEKILNRGIILSHIDTHHHIHLFPLVLIAVIKVAKKYNIRKIRTEKILDRNMNFIKLGYRHLHHRIVNACGFIQPNYYTDFSTFLAFDLASFNNVVVEIMCHPGSSVNDELFFNKEVFSRINHCLINYHDLINE